MSGVIEDVVLDDSNLPGGTVVAAERILAVSHHFIPAGDVGLLLFLDGGRVEVLEGRGWVVHQTIFKVL